MNTIFGLPAHPLLVHVPVVLLPLAAIGVVVMLIKPSWHRRYRWAVLTVGALGAIGAVWAASAGEDLEGRLRREGSRASWGSHAEAGGTARTFALLFAAVLAAYVLIPWYLERRDRARGDAGAAVAPTEHALGRVPRWLMIGLSVLALGGAAASVVTVIDAGHSGAKVVWNENR
jgi:uncharacterized membrane protein